MIGNDIVDLDDEETSPGALHPRFDERVFGGEERARVASSSNPNRLRWLLWAAKESAYKLLRRTAPDLVFSPRRFVVRAAGPQAATVEASGQVVCVRHECETGFVHCVASYHGAPPTLTDVGIVSGTLSPEHAGEAVRRMAVRAIARCLSIEERHLAVDRDGRLPVVLRRGRPLPGTLSLSHHGRFVAFAWRSGPSRCVLEGRADERASPARWIRTRS